MGKNERRGPSGYTLLQDQDGRRMASSAPVSVGEAFQRFAEGYVDFQGRARRSEFWWVALFIGLASGLIAATIPNYVYLWIVVLAVPSLALSVRRLHDTGRRGWWLLMALIPIVGLVIVTILLAGDSAPDNQWGPCMKK